MGKQVRYIIAGNGNNDRKMFIAAYRIGVGEIKVIGESVPLIISLKKWL